jgi:hypothetical protein
MHIFMFEGLALPGIAFIMPILDGWSNSLLLTTSLPILA